jgi:transcriptional regulator with XRE-family HTH domain
MKVAGTRGAVDRAWFNELLRSGGYTSQKAFAAKIGLDGPKLTNLLTGVRRPQVNELTEMARVLNVSVSNLLQCFGLGMLPMAPTELPLTAAVLEGDRIEFHAAVPTTIHFPVPDYSGVGIEVKTPSLAPRYLEGEVLGVRLDEHADRASIAELVGREVIAEINPAGFYLKILQPGTRRDRYSLVSLNAFTPPMNDVAVVQARPIDFHLPKLSIRQVSAKN